MLTKLIVLGLAAPVVSFDYSIIGAGSISLTDVATRIAPILTLFTGEEVIVTADGLEWDATGAVAGSDDTIFCETFLGGKSVGTSNMSLADVGRELPTSVDCPSVTVNKGGRKTITVKVTVDESEAETEAEFEAYGSGVAIIPLLVVLVLAIMTNMVEFSLYSAIFVGSCMVAGNINDGFKESLENYLLKAIADAGHVYVYLFTFFLSGHVAMMERSGGMIGFTRDISKYATSARSGQVVVFIVGCIIFFDDYANTLLTGQTMRPLIDSLLVSREKLAFFVDATAAPIASISPVSSWVGFEVSLIQTEIDKIIALEGTEDIGIKTSGFAVFLQSIKYRYYPIFMLVLIMILIYAQRDFGPMLIAERKTEVYKRTDGGDGSTSGQAGGLGDENKPRDDQPLKSWNMLVPIILLIFMIFYLLVQTGDDGSGDQSFMDKIESSDSYPALLWATMACAMLTLIFYAAQIAKDGAIIVPNTQDLKDLFVSEKVKEEDPEPRARLFMGLKDSTESFLIGMGRVFPASIVLTLAWASGSIMTAVGCDRLFASWIIGIAPELLPTLSFIISLFMALSTGTSWGTMSILFPLILVPTYIASDRDELIFYSTVAGILSGSVAGDHMSPISDTTVLSSLATECGLMNHVGTQAPYVAVSVLLSILVGTLPIGYDAWPNIVGILLGCVVLGLFVFFICKPIISPTGAWDIFTLLYLKISKDDTLEQLQQDTIRAANGEDLSGQHEVVGEEKKLMDSSAEASEADGPTKEPFKEDSVEDVDGEAVPVKGEENTEMHA